MARLTSTADLRRIITEPRATGAEMAAQTDASVEGAYTTRLWTNG
jgi:hypothetical protein